MLLSDFVTSNELFESWQNYLNAISYTFNVPNALIMRLVDREIEVFCANDDFSLKSKIGDKTILEDSTLYCEEVVKSGQPLHVPNALKSDQWQVSVGAKGGWISYLGLPINYPDGRIFGTICVIDKQERQFCPTLKSILNMYKELIEHQIGFLFMQSRLGDNNKTLLDYTSEIQKLRQCAE